MHTVNSFNPKLRLQSAAPLPLQLLPIQRPPSPRPAGDVASPTRTCPEPQAEVRAAPQISLVKFLSGLRLHYLAHANVLSLRT